MSKKEQLPRGFTSIGIYKHYKMYLSFVCAFTGKSKSQILNEYIKSLYDAVQPHMARASLEKKRIDFEVKIIAGILEPYVLKSRKVDFRKSNEQLDKEMIEDAQSELDALEGKTTEKILDAKIPIKTKKGKVVKP